MSSTDQTPHRAPAAAPVAAGFVAYLLAFAVLLQFAGHGESLGLAIGSAVGYAALLVALRRLRVAPAVLVWAIVLGGALLQIVALTATARTSDDAYRYVWDGRVQLSGIDPYRYAPASGHLAHLRDGLLFGPSSGCTYRIPHSCTVINRPFAHTVYPPAAQLAFSALHVLSFGGHGGLRAFQIAAALGAVAVSALLARRALRHGQQAWLVAVWAWCPITVSEFGNNAHIDWLAVLLCFGALAAAAKGRSSWAGGLLGAAVLTKIYPGLLFPSLARRHPIRVATVACAAAVVAYLPHLLAVGTGVLGYLPGYLSEEGYASGGRLLLLGAVMPHPADTIAGLLVVAVVAIACYLRTDPDAPERTAVVMVGSTFLVFTPSYGWYAALLVLLVAMTRQIEWLPVAFAPTLVYLLTISAHPSTWVLRLVYLAAAVAAIGIWRVRLHNGRDDTEQPDALENTPTAQIGRSQVRTTD